MKVTEIIVVDDSPTMIPYVASLWKDFHVHDLAGQLQRYRELVSKKEPDFKSGFNQLWESFHPLIDLDKVTCLMCADPDNLGAALVSKYLMVKVEMSVEKA